MGGESGGPSSRTLHRAAWACFVVGGLCVAFGLAVPEYRAQALRGAGLWALGLWLWRLRGQAAAREASRGAGRRASRRPRPLSNVTLKPAAGPWRRLRRDGCIPAAA